MYKTLTTIVFALVLTGATFTQNETNYCSQLKSIESFNKSETPGLTDAEEAEMSKYDVTFYEISLNMSNQNAFISGSGAIHGKSLVETDSILIELHKDYTIDSIYFNGVNRPYRKSENLIRVYADLPANEDFQLIVYYFGDAPDDSENPLGGSGLKTYIDYDGANTVYVTATVSQPFSSYEWFPVKQILGDKADSCAVNITIDQGLKAGSNGSLDSVTVNTDGTHTYHWFHRHPIAYYLISIAVGDYVEYNSYAFEGTPDEIFVQNYIYREFSDIEFHKAQLDYTPDLIELYSNLFGMYPYADEKYGHSIAPIFGAMENQTMTTMGVYGPYMTAHELAHQWWGNYVTYDTWANVWVGEGFASYAEILMYEFYYQDVNILEASLTFLHNSVKELPGGSVWVEDSTNISAIFNTRLTYNKGSAIVHILRYLINDDDLFFASLRTYLDTYKNSTATVYDFKNVIEQEASINLDDFFDQWYFGEGYPTYNVTWNYDENDLFLNINQTTSTQVTTLFTNPIDILVIRNSLPDTIVRVEINSNDEYIVIPNIPNVNMVLSVDPNQWIIKKKGVVQKDVNLTIDDDYSEIKQVNIYPNPAESFLNIEVPTEDIYVVEVHNLYGQILDKFEFNNSTTINVEGYESGGYIIRVINSNNKASTHRFIKI